MKRLIVGVVAIIAFAVAGCGGASTAADEEGRLISGEITDVAAASLAKAAGDAGECIGEVCAVRAYGENGEHVDGSVDAATHRWQLRVRAGNWMFGFLDGSGERLGYLAMNGITALTIEDGDDVDLGSMQLRNGAMVMERDAEGLGIGGIYTYRHRDRNRNGIPDNFEPGSIDDAVDGFELLLIRPFDGQADVAPCRPIKLIFSMPLDEATVSTDTVIVELEDGTPVDGSILVWQDGQFSEYDVVFTPTDGYPLGSTVVATVLSGPDGILSSEGDELLEDVAVSFTVRTEWDESQVCHDPDQERQQDRIRERDMENGGSAS